MTKLITTSIKDQAMYLPENIAIQNDDIEISYQTLHNDIHKFSSALLGLNIDKGSRIGVFLPKQPETVIAMFGSLSAGACLVPINPALRALQVEHILNDCEVSVLITSLIRLEQLSIIIERCPALKKIILVDKKIPDQKYSVSVTSWKCFCSPANNLSIEVNETDIAAIFYTSGSSGNPKGVVVTHRNLSVGAESVIQFLNLSAQDRILAVLPLSFDYGFSQLTTALSVGATVCLLDHLFPKDVINALETFDITGLAGIPTLWFQLAKLEWPAPIKNQLRYITNSGGVLSENLISHYRNLLPSTEIYLMYGLTEAFRSTYLEPDQIVSRPLSIGKAIPNAEVFILNQENEECRPDEIGELVHAGPLVASAYWNNPGETKKRFRPLPESLPSKYNNQQQAAWSGDLVKKDSEGYIYFVARKDAMIKTSGYRISPTEIEQVILNVNNIDQCAVFSVSHDELGQAIIATVIFKDHKDLNNMELQPSLKKLMPAYMIPKIFNTRSHLPMTENGKVDRKKLIREFENYFTQSSND
ncbi:MAG: acyl-CoA ligase (AMP-forming), exosortase A system-associated [Pseudomonadota bacterium]